MNPIVILTNFEEYLDGAKLDPEGPVEFKEVPIHDISQYVNYLINDRYIKDHGIKHGASLSVYDNELSLKVNSADLKFVDGNIPIYLDIGHARRENGIFILDELFQLKEDFPLTENQMMIGFSIASLMYSYATKLNEKFLLENNLLENK